MNQLLSLGASLLLLALLNEQKVDAQGGGAANAPESEEWKVSRTWLLMIIMLSLSTDDDVVV